MNIQHKPTFSVQDTPAFLPRKEGVIGEIHKAAAKAPKGKMGSWRDQKRINIIETFQCAFVSQEGKRCVFNSSGGRFCFNHQTK